MIERRDHFVHGRNRGSIRRYGPAQHDHLDAESARRGDLAVARGSAAVFRDHRIDRVRAHQRAVIGFAERPAIDEIINARQRQRWRNRIDAADEIKVLRRGGQRREFGAAERDKYSARLFSQPAHRIDDIGRVGPAIAGKRTPWWSLQRDQRHARLARRFAGVRRDHVGIRMRRVDQNIDAFDAQIFGKPHGAAEAATANPDRLPRGRSGATGQRHNNVQISALGQAFGQLPRFRRAAEDKDACHARCE